MKNILVVFTGGTIGSTTNEGTINTANSVPFRLIELFQKQDKNNQPVNFTTLQPLQILSENLAPCVWQTLIKAIEDQNIDDYDGIIITHGTDTLAYTSAALSFYFNALKIPMLLVASDYPLDNEKANGLINFNCAVEFIREHIQAGVFIPYRNPQQNVQIHRGSRLTCSLQLSGDFFSVQHHNFAHYDGVTFVRLHLSTHLSSHTGSTSNTKYSNLKAQFSNKILMIKPYPGLNYDHFNLNDIDAVLHDLYHSGTACASSQWGENYSLLNFINRCAQKNIKVYLAPSIKSTNAYQSTRNLIEQGAQMIWNMSIEAAYVKLMLGYGNFLEESEISAFIAADIAGEHI